MKKNRMMRLASILLVCVLLTTSVISGTFAKYVSSDNAQDSARVAKWGVDVQIHKADASLGAFSKVYTNDGTQEADSDGSVITNTVEAQVKVVAPGTSGYLVKKATISGTPEVAVNVKKEATLTLDGWKIGEVYYCPLIITVNDDVFNGNDYDSAEEFAEAVTAALNSNVNYGPNHAFAEDYNVSWAWYFENADGQDNVKDTALGDLAADGNAPTIAFSYKVTVEQID